MSPTVTACPLDCYDACRVVVDEKGKLKGDKTHPYTRGYLCPNLNHFNVNERISVPRLRGEAISIEDALNVLIDALREGNLRQTLYYRGSGNVGVMQRSVEHFFAAVDSVGTSGSLCDGAGEAGVLAGRRSNEVLPPHLLKESEVIVVWGRNIHATQSHILPFIEGKKIIVIDPVKTELAQKADLHIQIKPHCDLALALLLSRFAIIEGMQDADFLEKYGSGYNDFYELTQTVRIKSTLDAIDVSLGQIGAMLELMDGKKTAILVGVGVQKYRNGADVLRAIDGFGAIMGLFGKAGCGVSYVGNSLSGLTVPFRTIKRRVSKPTIDFSKYNCVFIQGGNPLEQMPNSTGVKRSFEKADFTVYFGLYENETSKAADLVIPAKTFLEKNDFRSSYGDNTFQEMVTIHESEIGISEYDLAKRLCTAFAIEMGEEEKYLEFFRGQIDVHDGVGYRRASPIPYSEGFQNDEFEFLDELDLALDKSEDFYLITPKHAQGLNSQFKRSSGVYLHPDTGFQENETVLLSSLAGTVEMNVKHDERVRRDCVLIYSGTPDVNVLTPPYLSYEGESAVYQEIKIKVIKKNDE
ncbi:MAG: molybdopterin-dependent oxidoreductase [Sulfuricurvum sp.]|nr:molybdopterin-dependent oxidoreductase [Sulfuricurvum sp.]